MTKTPVTWEQITIILMCLTVLGIGFIVYSWGYRDGRLTPERLYHTNLECNGSGADHCDRTNVIND